MREKDTFTKRIAYEYNQLDTITEFFDKVSDIVIVNTCSVTNNSDSKSRKMINQAIKNYPNACIVAMGCFIEANHDIEIDGVDILLGNKDKSKLLELIDEYFKNKGQIRNFYTYEKVYFKFSYSAFFLFQSDIYNRLPSLLI